MTKFRDYDITKCADPALCVKREFLLEIEKHHPTCISDNQIRLVKRLLDSDVPANENWIKYTG